MGLDVSTRGACFGFSVRSPLPFHYLREGGGEPFTVTEHDEQGPSDGEALLKEWNTANSNFDASLYGDGERYRLRIARSGWFLIDPQVPSVAVPAGADPVRREEQLWGIPSILCFLARGAFPLHAAAVEVDGGALILCGVRTMGKSTLAAGFASAGYRLLSEDVCRIDLSSVPPAVVPGPAMLRLRADVGAQLEWSFARRVKAPDEREHLAFVESARGDCSPIPVHAIVFLQVSEDGIRVEPVSTVTAVRDLFSLSFRLPDESSRARCFMGATDLARSVPVWAVYYARTLDELPRAVESIAALA